MVFKSGVGRKEAVSLPTGPVAVIHLVTVVVYVIEHSRQLKFLWVSAVARYLGIDATLCCAGHLYFTRSKRAVAETVSS